jgi:hypothetical protein
LAEFILEKHPSTDMRWQALLDLERAWKNSPKQARLSYLIERFEGKTEAGAHGSRLSDLKERLRRV